jgi:hypothetical protein
MEQEIVFAIARFIRTGACGQCKDGKQCQDNFFHIFSFCAFGTHVIIFVFFQNAKLKIANNQSLAVILAKAV